MYYLVRFLASPVGAAEHLKIPLLRDIVQALQCVNVARSDPESRKRVVEVIRSRATSSEPWPQLLIYSEGTCANGRGLIQFRAGAFIPGVPVQPVHLSYDHPGYPVFSQPQHCAWVNAGPPILINLLRMLCEPYLPLKCTFLPVYQPSASERSDPDLYASNVRSRLSTCQSLPVTEHSITDVQLQQFILKSSQRYLVPENMHFELANLWKAFPTVNFDRVKDWTLEYIRSVEKRNGANKGKLNQQMFLDTLGAEYNEQAEQGTAARLGLLAVARALFSCCVRWNNTNLLIDLREYLILRSLIDDPRWQLRRSTIASIPFALFNIDPNSSIAAVRYYETFLSVFPNVSRKSLKAFYDQANGQVKEIVKAINIDSQFLDSLNAAAMTSMGASDPYAAAAQRSDSSAVAYRGTAIDSAKVD